MSIRFARVLLAAAGIAVGLHAGAQAQTPDYPRRPVRLIVSAPAGSAADSLARALAEELGKRLGQPLVVDNKPGASGVVAAQALANAAPDGYTLGMMQSTPFLYAPHLMVKLPYNVKRDFTFIRPIAGTQFVLAVNKDVPARNVKELVAWGEKNKGKVSYGSYANGGAGHLMSAYLNGKYNLDMTHVPYKGEGPFVQDLVAGQVSWGIGTKGTMLPHIQSGRLRALAVVGDHRFADLPDLPTMAESGFPGTEFKPVGWFAVVAPAGLPVALRDRLDHDSREAMRSTRLKAVSQVFGLEPMDGSAADFRRDFDASGPLITRLFDLAGVKPE